MSQPIPSGWQGRGLFDDLTILSRAIERLHAQGEVDARSGVHLERALHPVVSSIAERGKARIGDIARDLGLQSSTVSRHVNQLVDRGLVEHVDGEGDSRATVVRLSPLGVSVRRALTAAWEDILREALETSSVSDVDRFISDFASFSSAVGMLAK